MSTDSRSESWSRDALVVLLAYLIVGVLGVLMRLLLPPTVGYAVSGSACQPDGTFSVEVNYSLWEIQGFFQIMLGFGALTFTQAKVIDIIWDVGVGRIGQTVLAVASWKAFSAYIRSSMDTKPVTYDTFWEFFMREEAAFIDVVRIVRDFSTRQGLRSRAAMVFIVASMIFVLAFPTLASAMTGYTQNSVAFVNETTGLSPFSKYRPVLYVVHDGERIDLSKDHAVLFPSDAYDGRNDPLFPSGMLYHYDKSYSCDLYDIKNMNLCYLQKNLSSYARTYGMSGLDAEGKPNNITSRWMGKQLDKPILNITSSYVWPLTDFYGQEWVDPRTKTQPFTNPQNLVFSGPANQIYSLSYIRNKSTCQPAGNYKWGFSFLQLFIVLLLLLAWAIGTMTLLFRSRDARTGKQEDRVPDRYKAAMMLVRSIQKNLEASGEDKNSFTDKNMEIIVNKGLGGGRIDHQQTL